VHAAGEQFGETGRYHARGSRLKPPL
jgi:hypothetical protein